MSATARSAADRIGEVAARLDDAGIRLAAERVPPVMRKPILALALAGGLSLAACGGGGSKLPDGLALPVPAAGPVPRLAIDPGSVSSPLPDIAVRRLNGEGGWVQLKNELPADKPLLVWFWAPH